MITEDDFNNWKNSPVGAEFRKLLTDNLTKLAYGNMTHSYCRDTVANAIEVGKFEATMFYLKLTYEQLVGGHSQ